MRRFFAVFGLRDPSVGIPVQLGTVLPVLGRRALSVAERMRVDIAADFAIHGFGSPIFKNVRRTGIAIPIAAHGTFVGMIVFAGRPNKFTVLSLPERHPARDAVQIL